MHRMSCFRLWLEPSLSDLQNEDVHIVMKLESSKLPGGEDFDKPEEPDSQLGTNSHGTRANAIAPAS